MIYVESINYLLWLMIIKNLKIRINSMESPIKSIWNLRKEPLGYKNLKLPLTMLLIDQIAMRNF